MVKRTKGYVLLILLVITGLASQVSNNTLTGKERKLIIAQLKESKTEFLQITTNLSTEQLAFKIAGKPSINELIQSNAAAEIILWKMIDNATEQSGNVKSNPENEAAFLNKVRVEELKLLHTGVYNLTKRMPAEKAIEQFTDTRNDVIKYAKTTTIDAHRQFVQTSIGPVSIYKILDNIPANTSFYLQQVKEIKMSNGFPK